MKIESIFYGVLNVLFGLVWLMGCFLAFMVCIPLHVILILTGSYE